VSRSSEVGDVRIAKAVPILRQEVTRSKDLDAEGNEGEFARSGFEAVVLFGVGSEGEFRLERLERPRWGGDHGRRVIRRGEASSYVMGCYEADNKRLLFRF
jgi:hypothetical protein